MPWMATDRRGFLALAGAGLLVPWLSAARPAAARPAAALYLSARQDAAGEYRLGGFDLAGAMRLDLPLPGRGHALAVHPGRPHGVIFARRPGRFALVIDLARGALVATIETPPGRHFYGHGVFSPAGDLLYATENDFAGERGVVGVYAAAAHYQRLGELPSHGVGPHDIHLLGDGETLVVANGGILTHPELPRAALNLPTMDPSLVYLRRRDGHLLGQVRPEPQLRQLSIRHLAVGPDDSVAVAMQYQGPQGDDVPLVALHRGRGPLRFCRAPHGGWRRLRQYCGSVVFDTTGTLLAVSSPRGNRVLSWEAGSGRFQSGFELPDGCGLVPTPQAGRFLVSSGTGSVVLWDARSGAVQPLAALFAAARRWDNHLAAAPYPPGGAP